MLGNRREMRDLGAMMKAQAKKTNEQGFTYVEVMCAMLVLLIGILGQLSALSWCVLRQREAEQQNMGRQIASSTLESIFAARDLGAKAGIGSWEKIGTDDANPEGIFVAGWKPVRQSAGRDGIQGTKDDACTADAPCRSENYTNTSEILSGFQRRIIITDIPAEEGQTGKKRRLEVRIRFFVGQAQREQTVATVIADLPFYK